MTSRTFPQNSFHTFDAFDITHQTREVNAVLDLDCEAQLDHRAAAALIHTHVHDI